MRLNSQSKRIGIDYVLAYVVLLVSLFGLVMVYDASVVSAFNDFGDKFHTIKYQALWLVIGLIGMVALSHIDYHKVVAFSKLIFFVNVILLVIVLVPGLSVSTLGAKRWISIGAITVQPAEILKLTSIVFFTNWLSKHASVTRGLFAKALVVLIGLLGLIMAEPDMGTAVVVSIIGISLLFLAGAALRYFAILLPFVLLIASALIALSPYRLRRLVTFLDPFEDRLASGYHINQVLIALGSGGWFGLGLGHSRQKYAYLPEASTDSIFAIIGEEIGFIGAFSLIAVFLWIIWRGIRIAIRAPDRAGQLLAGGIVIWIGAQALVNISAMVSLIPLTGVPLPFISYGGSSLVSVLLGVGILLNISRRTV